MVNFTRVTMLNAVGCAVPNQSASTGKRCLDWLEAVAFWLHYATTATE